jgi:hypothetical protein
MGVDAGHQVDGQQRVRSQQRHDAGHQQPERGRGRASSGQADGQRHHHDAQQRRAQVVELVCQRHAGLAGEAHHQERPGQQPEPGRHDERVHEAGTVAAGTAPAQDQQHTDAAERERHQVQQARQIPQDRDR